MLRRCSAVLAGLLLFGCLAGLEGVAHAATVTCGQVITQDTTLDADVGPCPNNGIIIGADGITLDLGGHTIFGAPPQPPPISDLEGNGILVDRRDRVRIRNGTVTGFVRGVYLFASSEGSLERLVLRDNRCEGALVRGLGGRSARMNLITGNVLRGNGCAGVTLAANSQNNTLERNHAGLNAGDGVRIQETGLTINTPRRAVARQNFIHNNGGDGIGVIGSFTSFHTFSGNVITGNAGNGVTLPGGGLTIRVEGNRIVANLRNGVLVRETNALFQPFGLGAPNEVVGNTALGNGLAGGFDLADENTPRAIPLRPGCAGTTWSGNTFLTRNQPCIN